MTLINTKTVLQESDVAFGTSGARGLVEDFTDNVCAAFSVAFADVAKSEFTFSTMAIAIDNRPSSYQMAQACCQALNDLGIDTIFYGVVPTPALAYSAMKRGIPSIMVTGSHIPFDRNGLKFYRPDGEITKADELSILANEVDFSPLSTLKNLVIDDSAKNEYCERYLSLFDEPILHNKHIGIYEHSSAGRDIYQGLFEKLGAKVTPLERSDQFVPIDTEAVSMDDQLKAKQWVDEYNFDAIFSTDGDGDRPLVSDEKGHWLRGDILGLLCAKALQVDALAIPVSCNSSIELVKAFNTVKRTKIGSPYVIAEFESLVKNHRSVAGFEANGGFLLGSDTRINGKKLHALPTRDALLPAIMLLALSNETPISTLVDDCSLRFSASDRIKNFATEKSAVIIATHSHDPSALIQALGFEGVLVKAVDLTDGLRITLSDENVIHLRPSGNAPELRCYAESDNELKANELVNQVLSNITSL